MLYERKAAQFKDYLVHCYEPPVCPNQQRHSKKPQEHKTKCNNKPTRLTSPIPTINK